MTTMNFSVPDDIRSVFNATFEGQNKSAIVVSLMREAVERARQQQAGQAAYLRILKRRASATAVTRKQILAAREAVRA